MNKPVEGTSETSGAISRARLEAVIRRAAELYAAEADADDGVSEAELLRIAEELGLPSRLVRQALYETTEAPSEPTLVDRLSAPATLSVSRVVPNEAALTFARLEEYLVTREYFQITRRQPGRAWFIPADDFVSGIVRAISRPSNRNALAHARGVALSVHPLEEGRSHVRIDMNYAHTRKGYLVTGGVVGGLPAGLMVGGLLAGVADALAGGIGPAAIISTIGAGMAASASVGITIAAAQFRKFRNRAAAEAEHLLDRVETGERLDPPPPPWRRRLQQHLKRLPGF